MERQNKLIDQFHKNSMELVEVHLIKWKDRDYVDLRIWTLPNPAEPGSQQPTKKGICLSSDLLPKLINALNKVDKVLKRRDEKPVDERSQSDEGNIINETMGGPGE